MSTHAKHTFQAEVSQLLDIVTHSLYTDREIFVRELVSNASDSLEKMRLTQLTEKAVFDDQLPLEINISTDETARTLTISDYGIGMTRDELIENLGTIAHSGSKAFVQAMKQGGKEGGNVIGQFGVGFYSAFMVASEVKVYTHSWRVDGEHLIWTSDGTTGYDIETTEGQRRGCKLVLTLKEDCADFAKASTIKRILGKYSNFVGFPIHLNGERVNTVEALWLKNKSEVTEEQYKEFYKFATHAFDEPKFIFHFNADAPLNINALLFAPTHNAEQFGMGQMEPGVSLYCRKVLIDPKPKKFLPDWMRFVRGVVDSEDLPLNISRETMQDSALFQKLGKVVQGRILKLLEREAENDAKKYAEFHKDFSRFLKEGVATDFENKEAIARLLRFESSLTAGDETIGLTDYVKRMKDGQKSIYYQIAPSREAIETGPYIEAFKSKGIEVLYLYETIDDYVVNALGKFDDKDLQSVTAGDVDLGDASPEGESLGKDDTDALCAWLKERLTTRVQEVRSGRRLVSSPAMALLPEGEMSPQFRQMMRALKKDGEMGATSVILEINPSHAIVRKLAGATKSNPELAGLIAEQILDGALMAAGLMEDPHDMIGRMNRIMEQALA